MTTTRQHLLDIHAQIRTDDKVMAEARRRRDRVLALASGFGGVRHAIRTGSVAMGVATDPVNDADGGIVLDRRCYPKLGPDSDGELPKGVVDDLHEFLGPLIREDWPDATVHTMRRGLTVRFHDPLMDQDPFVDLVVAMERRTGGGLWIPNINCGRWEASDPEQHALLMNTGAPELRTVRARVVRISKAWNKQYSQPALCSFNIVALALEAIEVAGSLDDALFTFFDHGVRSLREGCTADPAGVSKPIRLPHGKETAIKRLMSARDKLDDARAAKDDHERLAAMHKIFWNYLPDPDDAGAKQSIANALRSGSPRISTATGVAAFTGVSKPARAFGGETFV